MPNTTVPVVEVDEVFPSVTTVLPGSPSSGAGDIAESPAVSGVLANVLGWRPRPGDTTGFLAALDASFALTTVQGHVQSTYTPRGFAVQADLGGVTGGQASLWTRARAALVEMLPLIDGLTPLRPDADLDDCAAFQSLVRDELTRLVDELGNPGGPRAARVDNYLNVLVGWTPANTLAGITGDTVAGQIGAVRHQFGLTNANVNTIEDETVRTNFWTLSDLAVDLAQSWGRLRDMFLSPFGKQDGFLGTDLVVISRAMAAADDQVTELEAILDSVYIPKGERETLWLKHGGLTLDDLLSWLHTFLGYEGKTILSAGRDGIETSFSPVVRQLYILTTENLSEQAIGERPSGVVDLLPLRANLPGGMYAGRTKLAVASVIRLLRELYMLVSKVHRYPAPIIVDIVSAMVPSGSGSNAADHVQLSVRFANGDGVQRPVELRVSYTLEGVTTTTTPVRGSSSCDEDSATATFSLKTFMRTSEVVVELIDPDTTDVLDRRRVLTSSIL